MLERRLLDPDERERLVLERELDARELVDLRPADPVLLRAEARPPREPAARTLIRRPVFALELERLEPPDRDVFERDVFEREPVEREEVFEREVFEREVFEREPVGREEVFEREVFEREVFDRVVPELLLARFVAAFFAVVAALRAVLAAFRAAVADFCAVVAARRARVAA